MIDAHNGSQNQIWMNHTKALVSLINGNKYATEGRSDNTQTGIFFSGVPLGISK